MKSKGEEYTCLCIDRSRKKDQGRYRICNENKNTYIECTPEAKPFWLTKMLYSIKNSWDLEEFEELAPLQNQVEEARLQNKLCTQSFREKIKKVFEIITNTKKMPLKI